MKRRDFLKAAGAAAIGGFSITRASAQAATWPNKPVKLILPYAPGGATDLIGRPWAEKLGQAFGQTFVIENRGGASGAIGTEAVTKAAPDGYTFLLTPSAPLTILPILRQVPYDPITSFMPVARVGDLISGFVVHPSVGVKTFKELLDYAKKNPGKLSFGSAGLGTSTHMRVEMLKFRAGVDILHVPYRGSADSLNDLLAGSIQMMNEINPLPHVRAGKLILLNVNSPKRSAEWPDIPTLTELGFPELRRAELVFDPGAGGHARRHHPEIQRQGDRDCEDRRHAGGHDQAQRRSAGSNAGGDGRVSEERHQAQHGGHQGGEHQAGVIRRDLRAGARSTSMPTKRE